MCSTVVSTRYLPGEYSKSEIVRAPLISQTQKFANATTQAWRHLVNSIILNLIYVALFGSLLLATGCGGSGGDDDDDRIDTMEIDMAPLRVIAFIDDGGFIDYPLYPLIELPALLGKSAEASKLQNGDTILIRVFDPYGVGDFYSVLVSNTYGGGPHGATPLADDHEPDNDPASASVLNWGISSHHGLDPIEDEDWFNFTSSGECCVHVSTKPNTSGGNADPVLEVYDARPNLGVISFSEGVGSFEDVEIAGIFDPANNLTLVLLAHLTDGPGDTFNLPFSFIFAGADRRGDFAVRYAFPPVPSNAPGSVTGTVSVDRYDSPGGRLSGTFDITIVDNSRTTTVTGSFNVKREDDDAGLLTGFRSISAKDQQSRMKNSYKEIARYLNREL